MSEKKWVHINLPKNYVNLPKINSKTGHEFYSCTLPKNVQHDGQILGGYRFVANIIDDPIDWSKKNEDGTYERNPDAKYWDVIVPNADITLTKTEKVGDEYKAVDTAKINAADLSKAIREAYKEYRKEHDKEALENEIGTDAHKSERANIKKSKTR